METKNIDKSVISNHHPYEIEHIELTLKSVIESLSLTKLHIREIGDLDAREFIRRGLELATKKIISITPTSEDEENKRKIQLDLFRGLHSWCPEDIKKALEQGADVNARDDHGNTPLHCVAWSAAYWDNTEVAKLLIEKGANVNAQNEYGSTPLHRTAYAGRTEVAKLLLENGADVHARNNKGSTPLHIAAQYNRCTEIFELLKQHGGVA